MKRIRKKCGSAAPEAESSGRKGKRGRQEPDAQNSPKPPWIDGPSWYQPQEKLPEVWKGRR